MTDTKRRLQSGKNGRPAAVVPVTRLVSRPSLTIVNGRLCAVKVLVGLKAA